MENMKRTPYRKSTRSRIWLRALWWLWGTPRYYIRPIPGCKIRLKVNQRTGRLELSADAHSLFDIAWCTFATILAQAPAPEDIGKEDAFSEGIVVSCGHCKRFFVRRNNRQEYCDNEACQKARKVQNQRDFRCRKRIENAQKNKKNQ